MEPDFKTPNTRFQEIVAHDLCFYALCFIIMLLGAANLSLAL